MVSPMIHRPLDDLRLSASTSTSTPTSPPATLNQDDGALDVEMIQLPAEGLINLRVDPAQSAAVKIIEKTLDASLPQAPNTTSDDGNIWWLSIDEWMLRFATRSQADVLGEKLSTALSEHHHSLVDVSHQLEGFRVAGPLARDLLAHVITLDLHPRSIKPQMIAQTVAAHCPVTFIPRDDGDGASFDLYTRRSFATYLWRRLVDAASDMDLKITPADQ